MTEQFFAQKYYPIAVAATKGTPIFPDTVVTAAGLESGWNTSKLSLNDNNFFGFKASSNWTGARVTYKTTEYVNGQAVTVDAVFRKYPTPEDSFKDYVRLIQTARYVNAGVTTAVDSLAQFKALQAAGYATDPSYSYKLSAIYTRIKSFFVDSSTYVQNLIAENPRFSAAAGVGLIAVLIVVASIFASKTKFKIK